MNLEKAKLKKYINNKYTLTSLKCLDDGLCYLQVIVSTKVYDENAP